MAYPPIPQNRSELIKIFGNIEYKEALAGRIVITNGWAKENIVMADLPIEGRHPIHKLIEPVLTDVLLDIVGANLAGAITQFGCWNPRHKMNDPKRSLSLHSWGIAVDINWSTNAPGTKGDLHPKIVEIFKKYGWIWGGDWRSRDPMHFQLATSNC